MASAAARALGIYELVEQILVQLPRPEDILHAQQVCRIWANVFTHSAAVQKACWYRPHEDFSRQLLPGKDWQPAKTKSWKLNPVFERLGIPLTTDLLQFQDGEHECGNIDLRRRIYDQPGTWTTMLASQPPCKRMMVECYGDYSGDQTMFYQIESMGGCLLLGDVMAALAECQNRQECGVDRWAGVQHFDGLLAPMEPDDVLQKILKSMNDDVSIKVVVGQAWGAGEYPAFSLQRVRPSPELGQTPGPAHALEFLHEMILHRMISYGSEYVWDYIPKHGYRGEKIRRTCKDAEYQANLLVVKEHQGGYLEACSDIYRLLADV